MSVCGSVGRSTSLVQTQISRQLLDGLLQTFTVPRELISCFSSSATMRLTYRFLSKTSPDCLPWAIWYRDSCRPPAWSVWTHPKQDICGPKKNKNNELKDIKMLNRAEGNCRLCLKIQFKQLLCQVLSINPAVYETVCRQEQALVIKTDQSKYQSSYKCKWMRSLSERCMCNETATSQMFSGADRLSLDYLLDTSTDYLNDGQLCSTSCPIWASLQSEIIEYLLLVK